MADILVVVDTWWIWVDRQGALGPISTAELRRRCVERIIDPDTCVWRAGMQCWVPLRFVDELRALPVARERPDESGWFARARGGEVGPLTRSELWKALASGEVSRRTAVSYQRVCWVELEDRSEQNVGSGLRASPMLDELLEIAAITQRAVPSSETPGANQFGNYELLSPLGAGGMGEVFRARVAIGGELRVVALKRIRADLASARDDAEGFLEEARILLGLDHPNIIAVLDAGVVGDRHYLAMELAAGGSIQSAIRDRSLYAAGVNGILEAAAEAAEGLHYVHEMGHVHQDVKSANMLIDANGVTKVSDFGLCKTRRALADRPGVTAQGMTPAYASPEQMAALRDPRIRLTPRSDLWSWAVTVLEMFVGGLSWQIGPAAPHALDDYLAEPSQAEFPMPAAVIAVLRSCFAQDPERRPKTLLEVAGAIRGARVSDLSAPSPAKIAAVAGGLTPLDHSIQSAPPSRTPVAVETGGASRPGVLSEYWYQDFDALVREWLAKGD